MNFIQVLLCLVVVVVTTSGAKLGIANQHGQQQQQQQQIRGTGKQLGGQQQYDDGSYKPGQYGTKPMNYDFRWNVDAPDYDNYYGQQEAAVNGRVDGSYYVWQPDGRLMRVTYYVDGNSGFVPTISYVNQHQPQWGTPAYL